MFQAEAKSNGEEIYIVELCLVEGISQIVS